MSLSRDAVFVIHRIIAVMCAQVLPIVWITVIIYLPLKISLYFRKFENLIPDAPELIHEFLESEKDASCKRNAFMMLIHADQERALDYLSTCIDQVWKIRYLCCCFE